MFEMSPASLAEVGAALAAALEAQEAHDRIVEEKAVLMEHQRGIQFGSTWWRYLGTNSQCELGHKYRHFHWGRVLTSDEYVHYLERQGWRDQELELRMTEYFMQFQNGWRFSAVRCDIIGEHLLARPHLAGMWPVARATYRRAERHSFEGFRYRSDSWFESAFREYTEGVREQARQVGLTGHGKEGGDEIFVRDEGQ